MQNLHINKFLAEASWCCVHHYQCLAVLVPSLISMRSEPLLDVNTYPKLSNQATKSFSRGFGVSMEHFGELSLGVAPTALLQQPQQDVQTHRGGDQVVWSVRIIKQCL